MPIDATDAVTNRFRCHACGGDVPVLDAPALQWLVGSDCTPAPGGIEVGSCIQCGLLQKNTSLPWQQLCAKIYGNYQIYHQAAGHEQKARGFGANELRPRSELIAAFLRDRCDFPQHGSVLDIGCGNGAFLRGMSTVFPEWSVTGADLNAGFRDEIIAISPRASFRQIDELAVSSEAYRLASLIHCIEHIPAPVEYLADARRYIEPGGFLLIEVPDAELNPFDLVVADHASHFSKATLRAVVEAAGYDVIACGNVVIGKEITLLAKPIRGKPPQPLQRSNDTSAGRNLAWLADTLTLGRQLARESRPYGVFGTSIAGVWIGSALDREIQFYVDEDQERVGRQYFGVPIIAPAAIPRGATVFICLEPQLASAIASRHAGPDRRLVIPPPLASV